MKATIWACLCAAGLIAAVTAAAIGQATATPEPYEGMVNASDVHVRGRPGLEYPCTKVSYPTRVTVVGKQGEWLKILPVAGTFSVIEKQSVRLDATRKVGTVTEDNVWIRAGGKLHSQDFWAIQGRAKKGARVNIIGQTRDFYKITPPHGAHFWISGKFVTRVSAPRVTGKSETTETPRTVRIVTPGRLRTVTTKPVTDTDGAPFTKIDIVPVKTLKTLQSEAEIKAATAKFRAVDRLLAAEFRKPAEQRSLEPIIDKYEALRSIGSEFLLPYIDDRVKYIRAAIQHDKDITEVDNLIEETIARQKEYEQRRAKLGKPVLTFPGSSLRYVARGILTQSALFPGSRTAPKRYAIRGKHTRRIIAYVQCTTGDVDLSRYVGKEVGVTGTKQVQSEIGLIIDAQQVTVLGEGAGLPLPAAPTVIERRPRLAPTSVGPAGAPKRRVEPVIEPLPAPKPKAATELSPKPTPKSVAKPRPKPAPALTPLPDLTPGRSVDGVPLIVPRSTPTTKVTTPRPRLTTMPASTPTTRPVVKPLLPRPMPPTGLPLIESPEDRKSPRINEKEYE